MEDGTNSAHEEPARRNLGICGCPELEQLQKLVLGQHATAVTPIVSEERLDRKRGEADLGVTTSAISAGDMHGKRMLGSTSFRICASCFESGWAGPSPPLESPLDSPLAVRLA